MRDWDDVWLSEGFATYFTLLYAEQFDGRDAFVRGLRSSRDRILQLEKNLPDTPVIHRNLSDMRRVLNQFVYQKGGWTLHMLRYTIGTDRFWDGIREYYRRYQNSNASTDDLREIMERVSGERFDRLMDRLVLRPLELGACFNWTTCDPARAGRAASGMARCRAMAAIHILTAPAAARPRRAPRVGPVQPRI